MGPRMTPEELDERLFQTTRMIMIVLLLKLVVEDYIHHIAPHDPPLQVRPGAAHGKKWNRSSWIAVEFNLLYRWHMLAPDTVTTDDGVVDAKDFLRDNNALVVEKGIEGVWPSARSRAARIGLFNTPTHRSGVAGPPGRRGAVDRADAFRPAGVLQRLRSRFGLAPKQDFADLTADPRVQRRLEELYGEIEHWSGTSASGPRTGPRSR